MPLDERAVRMMRLLTYLNQEERAVPVGELAELAAREFGVSEVTLRSDLAALCSLHGVRKLARGQYEAMRETAGPALLGNSLFTTRLLSRGEQKIAIAGAVVRTLETEPELRVLLLDAGTTTYYVADRLSEQKGLDLLVWTPSVAAACRLAGARGVSVRLLGGEFQADYAVVSGDETARALRALAGSPAETGEITDPLPQFPGTHCVLNLNYLSPDGRLYTDESQERLQKRLMTELGEGVTLVADHTKLFGRRLGLQPHEVSSLQQLTGKRVVRLVTDAEAPEACRERARALFEQAFPGGETRLEESEGAVVLSCRPIQNAEPGAIAGD